MIRSFLLGAAVYPLIEICYRGRTHPAMALAGGLSGAMLKKISRSSGSVMKKALLGAAGITLIEYGMGMIFNRRHQIWDYRGKRGNIQGQICPQFFLVWMGMAAGFAFLSRKKMI